MPKSNRDYWTGKIARNRVRDQLSRALLEAEGWEVYIAWECQVKSLQAETELKSFLESFNRQ
jgi:DNA mismatch endonuclease (patch repair protein)